MIKDWRAWNFISRFRHLKVQKAHLNIISVYIGKIDEKPTTRPNKNLPIFIKLADVFQRRVTIKIDCLNYLDKNTFEERENMENGKKIEESFFICHFQLLF